MRILIVAASKHGSTKQIAKALEATLQSRGYETMHAKPEAIDDVSPYEAVVLGSAVYAGRWLKPAREFADRFALVLSQKPVWLFSSGPIGEPLKPIEDKAVMIDDIMELIHAKEHKLFAGKLDKQKLTFAEKAIVTAFRSPEGDYRDWDDIRKWGEHIADELKIIKPY